MGLQYIFNALTGKFDQIWVDDLTVYALLDGSNQPFTGNLNISKADPRLDLTDTGNNYKASLKKSDTNNLAEFSAEIDYNSISTDVKLLLHCDGADGGTTFTDSSTFARACTAVGSVTTQTDSPKFGTAAGYCNGAVENQHVMIPHSTDFNLGTTNFDVSKWVNFDTVAAGTEVILTKRSTADFDLGFIELQRSGANILLYATSTGGAFDIANGKVIGTITAGAYHYIRVSRIGNNFYMSIDGVQSVNNFSSAAAIWTNTDNMAIGTIPGQTAYTMTGYFDEVYIAIGASVFGDTGNFTPPTAPWGIIKAEVTGFAIQDGAIAGEVGIAKCGTNTSRTIINGRSGSVSIQVAGTELVNITSAAIVPTTDNTPDLGTSTKRFKDFHQSGDLIWYGEGSGLAFAEIYVKDGVATISCDADNADVKVTQFTTNGLSNNCTADAANDKITFTQTGKYQVKVCLVVSIDAGAVTDVIANVYLNGTIQNNIHANHNMTSANPNTHICLSGFVDVTTAAWDLDVRLNVTDTNARAVTVTDANLSVVQIGGT